LHFVFFQKLQFAVRDSLPRGSENRLELFFVPSKHKWEYIQYGIPSIFDSRFSIFAKFCERNDALKRTGKENEKSKIEEILLSQNLVGRENPHRS